MQNFTNKVQHFGKFLSSMVMPNIGAFIAWGFITAFFIETGWLPNEQLATLVGPMLKYLLPLLIAYSGGKLIAGERGAIIGVIGTIGVVVGADIPMLIGAMIMGPFAGLIIKSFDKLVDGKIPTGFEMLVNNFSIGILGMLLTILGFYLVGPAISIATGFIESGVVFIMEKGFLPLVSIFIEPAKILFLNNAVNHGILTLIGLGQAEEMGKSVMFLLESNPGPGLGILLAYFILGKGNSKQSAPGAIIIQFFGGIHEIYFPYVLMNPILILAVILGGASGVFVFTLLGAGLVAAPSPGSILAILALIPKGEYIPVLAGIATSTIVTFFVAAPFIKKASLKEDNTSLEQAKKQVANNKQVINNDDNNVVNTTNDLYIKHIVFACDAGMGSSAMGASRFKSRIKDLDTGIKITNSSVDNLPEGAQIVVTHKNLVSRVIDKSNTIEVISIENFLKDDNLDKLYERIENIKKDS